MGQNCKPMKKVRILSLDSAIGILRFFSVGACEYFNVARNSSYLKNAKKLFRISRLPIKRVHYHMNRISEVSGKKWVNKRLW